MAKAGCKTCFVRESCTKSGSEPILTAAEVVTICDVGAGHDAGCLLEATG